MTTLMVVPINKFVYGGDASMLGGRWTDWNEMFDLYVTANELKSKEVIRATFLTLVGEEVYQIYKSKAQMS